MPLLVLLSGVPASGKSTLAHLWARERPFALSLDIDVLRAMIADWETHPIEAGLRARDLAITMITDHLARGHDVIVPQFLTKPEFADRLSRTATTTGARFIEVALIEASDVAEKRFLARADSANGGQHDRTIHGPLGPQPMRELVALHQEFIDTREGTVRVTASDGNPQESLRRFTRAIESLRSDH